MLLSFPRARAGSTQTAPLFPAPTMRVSLVHRLSLVSLALLCFAFASPVVHAASADGQAEVDVEDQSAGQADQFPFLGQPQPVSPGPLVANTNVLQWLPWTQALSAGTCKVFGAMGQEGDNRGNAHKRPPRDKVKDAHRAWADIVVCLCSTGKCVPVGGCVGGRAHTGACRGSLSTPHCCVPAVTNKGYLGRLLARITESAAARLSPANHQAKWARFKALHRKAYSSPDVEAQRFAAFKRNREFIVHRNDQLGRNIAVFSSVSKFADIPPEKFKATYLRLTTPVFAYRSTSASLLEHESSMQSSLLEEGFMRPEYVHSTEHETVQLVRETAVLPPWEEEKQQQMSEQEQETQFLEEEESMSAEAESTEAESVDEAALVEESSESEASVVSCTSHGKIGKCLAKGGCSSGETQTGLCPGTTICCFEKSGVIVAPLNLPAAHREVGGVLSIDYRNILSPIKDQGQSTLGICLLVASSTRARSDVAGGITGPTRMMLA
jgi:hypothetical protein